MGCHPLFFMAKALRRIPDRPVLLRSLCQLAGFLQCTLRGEPREVSGDVLKYVRAKQLSLLLPKPSIRTTSRVLLICLICRVGVDAPCGF
jgi:hypothetical protein